MSQPPKESRFTCACFELTEVLVSAVLAIAILFSFALRFAGVLGHSMLPTLHHHDRLAVTAHMSTPRRGAIVIISPRANDYREPLVKRIVAIAGDEVDLRDGRVWINGQATDEPYLPASIETSPAPGLSDLEFPVVVPENEVFVLGDNRGGSTDSRHGAVGFVRTDDILGRVLFRMWPSPRAGF